MYPRADYFTVTLESDAGSEFDLGYECDDALTLAQARDIARRHEGAQIWGHGRFPGARASVCWRVHNA
jgi:hypothetical protein